MIEMAAAVGSDVYDEVDILKSVYSPAKTYARAKLRDTVQDVCSSCHAMLDALMTRELAGWIRCESYPWYFEFNHACRTSQDLRILASSCALCKLASSILADHSGVFSFRYCVGNPLSLELFDLDDKIWMKDMIHIFAELNLGSPQTSETVILTSTELFPYLTPILRTLPGRNSRVSHLKQARSWLDACLETHSVCRQPKTTRKPKRLLQISPTSNAESKDLRLCDGGSVESAYVALSYCWGGRLPLRSTHKNLSRFIHSIPWDELPLTFKDAINFTHDLGYSYLWIDALCIVQDDPQEWTMEAQYMHDIYTGAVLTLSAMYGSNCCSGMSHRAHPDSLIFPGEISSVVSRTETIFHAQRTNRDYFNPDYALRGPLSWRAWVLQERILSKAVLHFTGELLIWDCSQLSQTDVGQVVGATYSADVEPTKLPCKAVLALPELGILRWFRLVEEYCQSSLTKASDKLPASGGLAKWMQQYVGGIYVAGLWEEYFVHCLLWTSNEDKMSRPSEYRAPTWSWASVEGPVSYWKFLHQEDISSFRSMLSSVHVETNVGTESSYGEAQGGEVQLEGWLTEKVRTEWLNRWYNRGSDDGWYVYWDTPPEEAFCQLLCLGICTDSTGHKTEEYLILGHVNSHSTMFSRLGVASADISKSGRHVTEIGGHGSCFLNHTQTICWPQLDITTTLKWRRITIV